MVARSAGQKAGRGGSWGQAKGAEKAKQARPRGRWCLSDSQHLTAQIIQIGLKDQPVIPKSQGQRKPCNSPEPSGRSLSLIYPGFSGRVFSRLKADRLACEIKSGSSELGLSA